MMDLTNKRNHSRKACFQEIYCSGEEPRTIGLITNISETGANIWVDSSKFQLEDQFKFAIKPPGGTSILGFMDFDVEVKWSKDTNTDTYKNIGCEFVSKDEQKMQSVIKYFSVVEELDKLKKQYQD